MARVLRERTEGKTAYAIARDLNKDAVPTAQGARLVPSHVRALARRRPRSLRTWLGLPSWNLGSRLGRHHAKLRKERHLVEIQVLRLDLAILNLED